MLTTKNLTTQENITLSDEIKVIGVTETPLTTLLMQLGKIGSTGSKIHTWRNVELDTTSDITVVEGLDNPNSVESKRSELSNICEILLKATSVSGTAQATNGTGTADMLSSEVANRLKELKRGLEVKLINGKKNDGSTAGSKRQMSGLLEWVPASNKVAGATKGVLIEDEIKQLARKLYDKASNSGQLYLFANADMKEKIDEIYKDKYFYSAPKEVFGFTVQQIITNYGTLNVVLSRDIPDGQLLLMNLDLINLVYLRAPQFEQLAKTGDSVKGQVLLEGTLEMLNPDGLALYSIKTT